MLIMLGLLLLYGLLCGGVTMLFSAFTQPCAGWAGGGAQKEFENL